MADEQATDVSFPAGWLREVMRKRVGRGLRRRNVKMPSDRSDTMGRRYAPLVRAAKLVLAADAMCAKEAPGCDRGWDMAMEELRRAVKGLKQ